MVSTKPYLLRAIFEWCVDQGYTPYLQVVVDARTRVPREYVKEGQIVLNLSPEATQQMIMGNEEISFQARFSGSVFPVSVPMGAVVAIYARENGQGMSFELAPGEQSTSSDDDMPPDPDSPAPPRPKLTRVK